MVGVRAPPASPPRELRPLVSRRVHPATAAGLGLSRHPVPELPRPTAGSAQLRWRWRWARLRGVASPDRRPLLFRVLLAGALAVVAWQEFHPLDDDHLAQAGPA